LTLQLLLSINIHLPHDMADIKKSYQWLEKAELLEYRIFFGFVNQTNMLLKFSHMKRLFHCF